MSHSSHPRDEFGDPTSAQYGADAPHAPAGPYGATPQYGPSNPAPGTPYGSPYGNGTTGQGHPQDTTPSGVPYAGSTWHGAPSYPGPGAPGVPTSPVSTAPAASSERSMAMLAHLSLLIAMLLSAGWLTFVGPLVIWAVYKDKSPFVRQAAAGSFNFALTATLASIIGWAAAATFVGIIVAIPIWLAVFICSIVFPVMGAMRADKLQPYHYPMSIPVLN